MLAVLIRPWYFKTPPRNNALHGAFPDKRSSACLQVAELVKERDFAAASKHAAAEAAAALESRLRVAAEQHKADVKALQSQISQLKVLALFTSTLLMLMILEAL